jgi:hypothetical protein
VNERQRILNEANDVVRNHAEAQLKDIPKELSGLDFILAMFHRMREWPGLRDKNG